MQKFYLGMEFKGQYENPDGEVLYDSLEVALERIAHYNGHVSHFDVRVQMGNGKVLYAVYESIVGRKWIVEPIEANE